MLSTMMGLFLGWQSLPIDAASLRSPLTENRQVLTRLENGEFVSLSLAPSNVNMFHVYQETGEFKFRIGTEEITDPSAFLSRDPSQLHQAIGTGSVLVSEFGSIDVYSNEIVLGGPNGDFCTNGNVSRIFRNEPSWNFSSFSQNSQ